MQNAPFAIPLETIRLGNLPMVGTKAARCGELRAAGFPLPGGVCLTTAAFELGLEPYRAAIHAALGMGDLRQAGPAGQAAGKIAEILAGLEAPEDVMAQARSQLDRHGETGFAWAVRSSAVEEDLSQASFAGLHDTTLGVQGESALRAAIVACWKSYYSAAAIATRAALGRAEGRGMGVLLQEMVAAECAGVCYTLDPVEPDRVRVAINAAWGLGSGVVDGSVAADTAWLRRTGLELESQRVVEKDRQIVLRRKGGVGIEAVDAEKRRAACLPPEWLARVAQFGLAAEALLGGPQEVEWAIAEGRVWILQSRPIASLPPAAQPARPFPVAWKNDADRRRFWQMDESSGAVNRPLYPLEQAELAAVEATRIDTCRWLGVERNQRLAFQNGRAYTSPEPSGLSPADQRLRQEAWRGFEQRLAQQSLTSWDLYGPEVKADCENLATRNYLSQDGKELAEILETALAARRRGYMLHPLFRFKAGNEYFQAYQAAGGQSESQAYRWVLMEETITSRMMDDLYNLAHTARMHHTLAEWLASPGEDSLQRLKSIPGSEEFRAQVEEFLETFGERNGAGYGSEATLLRPTWREQPHEMLRLAAGFLDADRPSPRELRQRAREIRDRQVDELCQQANPKAAQEFRRQLAYAGRLASILEEHNHYIDQLGVGLLRRAVLAAGAQLAAQGSLTDAQDVAWLSFDEILMALRSDHPIGFRRKVARRRSAYARWKEMTAPPCLGIPPSRLPERPAFHDETSEPSKPQEGLVTGLGASAGQGSGRARLILDVENLPPFEPGDVLVAPNAGPRWTPLMAMAGGLVLDGGSLAQHPAAIAREYGLPAVIDTRDATRRIAEGDWVTVDGSTGQVRFGPFHPSPR